MKTVLAREARRAARISAQTSDEAGKTASVEKTAGKTKAEDRDDEDEPGADDSDDEDEPKAKKSKRKKAAIPDDEEDDGADAATAERKRCMGLAALQTQADRLGVDFDASAAIAKGMSVEAARKAVLDAAAEADAPDTSAVAAPKNRESKGATSLSADQKQAAWKKAMKRR